MELPNFPFALERPLLFFDIEATGPNPGSDRIVELGFVQFKPDGTSREWRTYLNPEMPIPYEATYGKPGATEDEYQGHGITDAMVQGCRHCEAALGAPCLVLDEPHQFHPWPTFRELAASFQKGFTGSDFGGYNIRGFDLPIMAAEFERAGIKNWSYDDAKLVDSYRLWQVLSKRTLADAVRMFLGEELEGAHGAVADIVAALRVAIAQIDKLPKRPGTLAELHEICYPRDPNAVDPGGKILFGPDGDAVVNFGKKWKGKKLRNMLKRDLEWVVDKADGMSPTVKAICRDALMGKYPVRTNASEPVPGRGGVPGGDGLVHAAAVPSGPQGTLFDSIGEADAH